MALSPDEKFIYVNPDTTSGEYNSSQYFPVKYLRGLECPNAAYFYLYFRGPKDAISTRVQVSITSGFIKEFFTQFVDEINFGENSVITLADRNIAVDSTSGGTVFQHVNAYISSAILSDTTTAGYEDVAIYEDLDIGGDLNVNVGVSNIETRKFSISSTTDGDYNGDVVYFGSGTVVVGKIYHYKSDGSWELADATDVTKCDGLLGVALDGGTASAVGMLLRGMVTLIDIQGTETVGGVLYLSETATGNADIVAPSANNEVVRIIGYCLTTDDQIWFNPDNTYVEVTA